MRYDHIRSDGRTVSFDTCVIDRLRDHLQMFGVRSTIMQLCVALDRCAERAAANHNTVLAKQWAAWAVAVEALRDFNLADPGR